MSMTHVELAADLAADRRKVGRIVATEVGLGSWGGRQRLDVLEIRPSWTKPNPTAYEVKVSRADFLRDAQGGKWQAYLPYVCRLYFAAESGLLKPEEIPEGCGLITRAPSGNWTVRKAPKARMAPAAEKRATLMQALLMKEHPGPWAPVTRAQRLERAGAFGELRLAAVNLTDKVRGRLQEIERQKRDLDNARWDLVHALGETDTGQTVTALVRQALASRKPALESSSTHLAGAAARQTRYLIDRLQELVGTLEAVNGKGAG